jgi:Na+-translocating ferredoxin:NAD+ oxidoreductase RnfG subunit
MLQIVGMKIKLAFTAAILCCVGLNADGSVKQIEIMDYRETLGGQIRDQEWRAQFVGKNSRSTLKLDSDIKNISGATLSCRHITDGVKRVVAFYEIVLKH